MNSYNSSIESWSPWSQLSCCTQLAASLGSLVSYPNTTTYDTSQASYWSLQESDLSPACVFSPQTAQDVAQAVTILTSSDTACQFAIKGQTHAPAAGFANIDGGVTIDLTGLNSTVLSSDRSVVSVGGGISWIEVYRYLNPELLAVAGGRNGLVGVGGLTLGGGISHFTTRVGFACDNVVNFEVVLASGTLTNVNKTFNPELFLALKGGATNFGIVTRFDLATFAQGQISVNTIVNSISQRDNIFSAFTNIASTPTFDPYVSLVSGLLFNSTSKAWTISTSAVYTEPIINPVPFQELLSIPNILNTTTLTNLSTFAAEANTPPLNWLFWTGTYKPSAEFMSELFTILNDTLYDFTVPEGVIWDIAFEPLPSIIPAISKSKGGNSLGLDESDGNAFIMLLSALWPSTASNNVVEATARQAGSRINALASSMGTFREFQYLNYADPSQSPIQSYGAESVEMLRNVSLKYDPNGVFQKRVPGGFKLW